MKKVKVFLAVFLLGLSLTISPAFALEASRYRGRLISIDLQDTNIDLVFRIFAEVSGKNIAIHPDVHGEVSLRLIDVPWDQAFDIVLRMHGLYVIKEGNVMLIFPVDKVDDYYRGSG